MSGKLCPNGESFIESPVLTPMTSCIVGADEMADNDILTGFVSSILVCVKRKGTEFEELLAIMLCMVVLISMIFEQNLPVFNITTI